MASLLWWFPQQRSDWSEISEWLTCRNCEFRCGKRMGKNRCNHSDNRKRKFLILSKEIEYADTDPSTSSQLQTTRNTARNTPPLFRSKRMTKNTAGTCKYVLLFCVCVNVTKYTDWLIDWIVLYAVPAITVIRGWTI